MNCYYHPTTAAVGMCRQCSRGLCVQCAHDEGYGLACRGKHEAEVRAVQGLIETNLKSVHDAPRNMWLMPMLNIILGIVFVGYGILRASAGDNFLLIIGGVFLLFGILNAWRAYRIFGDKKREKKQ